MKGCSAAQMVWHQVFPVFGKPLIRHQCGNRIRITRGGNRHHFDRSPCGSLSDRLDLREAHIINVGELIAFDFDPDSVDGVNRVRIDGATTAVVGE